jgi:hypothetical protein
LNDSTDTDVIIGTETWLNDSTDTDVIIGTETWLNDSIYSSEVIPTDQFDVYRNDRVNSKGGGVLVAVRKTLVSSKIFKSNNNELLAVKLHHTYRSSIICAYL